MNCAVCGIAVRTEPHYFYEGLGPESREPGTRPLREWVITAPLYFKANAENTKMIEGYCGPMCATKALGR